MLRSIPIRSIPILAFLLAVAACEPQEDVPPPEGLEDQAEPIEGITPEQEAFWSNLEDLCGMAFPGQVTVESAIEDSYEGLELVMHVRHCEAGEIQIPFHVAENRSRTWIVTQTDAGLRLKHDHRHEDGTEDEITWYGGDTEDAGSPEAQHFHADDYTAALLPEAATNVWTMEVLPGERFAYELVRHGTDRRVRFEFDLTSPVDAPPPPWGYEDTEPTH